MLHAHSDHELRIRLIPSRTPRVFQCKDIGIVRVVVVLRVVVLAFVAYRWHITVRVAGYTVLQGKVHSLTILCCGKFQD